MRALSAGLALVGMVTSISGVAANEFKPVFIGLVLLSGATVFALLHIGSRSKTANPSRSIHSSAAQEVET
jgi:hypothetical protein